ncbi:MAG: T9SS type A sorting domain-containing protein, partial [Bacteroidota bacterium]
IGRYSATGRLLGKVSWPNDPRRILKGAAYSGFGDAVFAGYQDNAFTPSGFFDDFYFARVSGVGNHYCSSQFFCPEDSTWIGTDTVGNVKPVSNRVYLGQNMPNPVGESTSIPYFIPEGVKQAEIIVHDVSGRELSTIPLLQSKHGIHLFSLSGMPSGIYAYSLITDGTPIATLKMVVIK